MPTTPPEWSKIMKRVLVVPWSSAPTYSAMRVLLTPSSRISRESLSGRPDQQPGRGGPRVLMPGAALSHVTSPALARPSGEGVRHPLPARLPRGGERGIERGASLRRLAQRVGGRLQGVDHGLVPELGLAPRPHRQHGGIEGLAPVLGR